MEQKNVKQETMNNLLGQAGFGKTTPPEEVVPPIVEETKVEETEHKEEVVPPVVEQSKDEEIDPKEIDPDGIEAKEIESDRTPPDYNKLVLDKFGYNSIDDLINSDAGDKLKQFEQLSKDLGLSKKENEELLGEFSNKKTPFANDHVLKLNYLLEKNPDMSPVIASRLISGDLSNMSDLDKIFLVEQIKNPDLTDRHIRRSLEKEFGVESYNELFDAELDEDIKLDIETKSSKAKRELSKFDVSDIKADDTYIPENIQERITQKIEASKLDIEGIERTWTPSIQYMEENFKEIDIPSIDRPTKEIKKDYVKYVLNEQDRHSLAKIAMDYVKKNNIKEITTDSQNKINREVFKELLLLKLPNIIQTAVDKATSDEFARYKQNRDGVPNKDQKPDSGNSGKKTFGDFMGSEFSRINKKR